LDGTVPAAPAVFWQAASVHMAMPNRRSVADLIARGMFESPIVQAPRSLGLVSIARRDNVVIPKPAA